MTALTADQAAYIGRARRALEAGTGEDGEVIDRLARRVSALELHMSWLLDLVGELAGKPVAAVQVPLFPEVLDGSQGSTSS